MTRSKLFLATLLMSISALASYPWLGCTGGPYDVRVEWGISQDVMCIGKETTWEFCRNVLEEVCKLFPGDMIHIGGDEVLEGGVSKQCVVMSWLNGIEESCTSHVLGVQCNTWTEHISAMDRVYFMNLPRMAALAEVAWSVLESLSGYQDFLSRLTGAMIPLYTSAGWPFAKYYEEDLK